jgi:hypothetical protein
LPATSWNAGCGPADRFIEENRLKLSLSRIDASVRLAVKPEPPGLRAEPRIGDLMQQGSQ